MKGIKLILVILLFLPLCGISSGENIQNVFISKLEFVTNIQTNFINPSANVIVCDDDFDLDISNSQADLPLDNFRDLHFTHKAESQNTPQVKQITFSPFLLDLPPPSL